MEVFFFFWVFEVFVFGYEVDDLFEGGVLKCVNYVGWGIRMVGMFVIIIIKK